MSEGRWSRIDHLVQSALARTELEREPYVREACGGDAALCDEVLSLLRHAAPAEQFLEPPVARAGSPVEPGQQLGPYRVEVMLGAGGMAEVYRAHDTRLGRKVAIKILPRDWASDPDRLRRFEHEARAIAALNDPHICTLYDVGEENGTRFLVMELVEGVTLADRLARGPMTVDETLRYGAEVAGALDRAHRLGIVHRDLKPANVMLTKAGAKLLDFGLAKLRTPDGGSPSPAGVQTAEGVLIGTLPYMAPEQLDGRATDARTDLWALGCVLYEMLTGVRPFDGASQATLIAAILEREPPAPMTLQPLLSPVIDHLVQRCLAKSPDERWQSAGDLAHELRWVADQRRRPAAAVRSESSTEKSRRTRWIAGGVAIALAAVGIASLTPWRSPQATGEVLQFDIQVPESVGAVNGLAVSPDGLRVSYVGANQLWVHDLETNVARPVAGVTTDLASFPFWSPDGQSIAYFFDGWLKKVPASGGIPKDICAAKMARGGSWSADGIVIFAVSQDGIFKVGEAGGTPVRLTAVDQARGEIAHLWPHFVDNRRFTYSMFGHDSSVHLASLDSASHPPLAEGDGEAYIASGVMLRVDDYSTLSAQRVSLPRLERIGESTPLARQIAQPPTRIVGQNAFAASDGTLVYSVRTSRRLQFTEVDQEGRPIKTIGQPDEIADWSLARDGSKLALSRPDGARGAGRIWQLSLVDGRLTPLTKGSVADRFPIWSPDSSRIAFVRVNGGQDIHVTTPGSETDTLIGESNVRWKRPYAWHRDGTLLFGMPAPPSRVQNLWRVSAEGGKPELWVKSDSQVGMAQFSADGRWVTYHSQDQVWVRSYADAASTAISIANGWMPQWRPDGNAIFYLDGDALMELPLTIDGSVKPGPPRKKFGRPGFLEYQAYAVLPNGKSFLVTEPVNPAPRPTITVVRNWAATLTQK